MVFALDAIPVKAQSWVGFSYNVFLESESQGAFDDIVSQNTRSMSIRYARKNMFAEIRWQQFNIKDSPRWKDPIVSYYDSTLNRYVGYEPAYQQVGQSNSFNLNYVRFIIGPRFELLKHIAYEIGSSLDFLVYKRAKYAKFEHNPYYEWEITKSDLHIQTANIHFYSRIQAWYDFTPNWRASLQWEFNIPFQDELLERQGYGSNSGKSVVIEPVTNGAQFFLNFLIEYKLH